MLERLPPRGSKVALPHGALRENYNPYLERRIQETGGAFGPLGLQFRAQPELEALHYRDGLKDSLIEDMNEVASGLVYKYQDHEMSGGSYPGRALWTVTRNCAAYCRFCTRGREVGLPVRAKGPGTGALSEVASLLPAQIEETLEYIRKKEGLNEIILSGGDPLLLDRGTFQYVLGRLRQLQDVGKLDIVRIGTRVPVQDPPFMREDHYKSIAQLKNPFMMIHINCIEELTPETLEVLNKFRKDCNALVLSQTVLLKGVNSSTERLAELFNKMAKEGIRPYYVYQNDEVYWAEHDTVPIEQAIEMCEKLRPILSGVAATARIVIDTPEGYGKIAIPEGGFWNVDFNAGYRDFTGTRFDLKTTEPK